MSFVRSGHVITELGSVRLAGYYAQYWAGTNYSDSSGWAYYFNILGDAMVYPASYIDRFSGFWI